MKEKIMNNKYSILVNNHKTYNSLDFKDFKYREIISTDCRRILIEEKTYVQFNKLKEEMKKLGIIIGIKHALRNEKEQAELYKEFCLKYGKSYADKIVCTVGTSEHHTGLAIDIEINIEGEWISNNEHIELTEPILKKIHPFLSKYGFILRYPKNKENITGLVYEPWHIRYVGNELATYLFKENLVLDEKDNHFAIDMF